jgi:protein phosphatase
LRKGRLRQFTRDQTVAEFMVDAGRITEEQARESKLANVLTSAIGGDQAAPSVGLVDFEAGDVLLLCTDGLTRHVSDERIREILESADDAESGCNRLVDEALAGGGRDNITVVVVRMGHLDEQTEA